MAEKLYMAMIEEHDPTSESYNGRERTIMGFSKTKEGAYALIQQHHKQELEHFVIEEKNSGCGVTNYDAAIESYTIGYVIKELEYDTLLHHVLWG